MKKIKPFTTQTGCKLRVTRGPARVLLTLQTPFPDDWVELLLTDKECIRLATMLTEAII